MPLLCPHCERDLACHDGKPCPRKFSRRFFFGLMAGAVAANPTASVLTLNDVIRIDQMVRKSHGWSTPITVTKAPAGPGFPCITLPPEVFTIVSAQPLRAIRGNGPNRQTVNFYLPKS